MSHTHHPMKHTHARPTQSTPAQSGIHVAIIMDGNGRWANARGRPRTAGHIAGARVVRKIVEAAPDSG
ncbi:MAG TPA: undecaprenyl diphosphate synthase family protein, partial [Gemmatimonadaceae bacterium]|nr:undecaprenyl diphosphate synthase family protein [Gemmatimonadaceae bacterium]